MIRFEHTPIDKLDFEDVLLEPAVSTTGHSSREQVILNKDGAGVPVIVANMDHIGTFFIAHTLRKHGLMVALLKDFTVAEWEKAFQEYELDPRLLIPTLGIRDLPAEIEKIKGIVARWPSIPFVCMDVPNGYLQSAADAVKAVKDALPHVKLAAGNIVNIDGVNHLHGAGADIVKVGIGSGAVCLTRKMTGVGYPQFSAIHDMAAEAHRLGVPLISDGGISTSGDMGIAFAAGAHYVMAGSIFAGHEETGLEFHGMSSHLSRQVRGERPRDYRASEGREVILKSRGPIDRTATEILGGLRSTCTYLSAEDLDQLRTMTHRANTVRRRLRRIEGVASEA